MIFLLLGELAFNVGTLTLTVWIGLADNIRVGPILFNDNGGAQLWLAGASPPPI